MQSYVPREITDLQHIWFPCNIYKNNNQTNTHFIRITKKNEKTKFRFILEFENLCEEHDNHDKTNILSSNHLIRKLTQYLRFLDRSANLFRTFQY